MFRSSKKLDDAPKVMSMQEIKDDLQTFVINQKLLNRSQILEDLKVSETKSSLQ